MVANTDKNLGPCVIELARYIQNALSHLNNPLLYESLTEEEADAEAVRLERETNKWAVFARTKLTIDDNKYKYILRHTAKNSKDPHGYFYLLYKVHKQIKNLGEIPSQPVCSG